MSSVSTCILMFFVYLLHVDPVTFPAQLACYGLTFKVLDDAIENMTWSLCGIPNVEFYRKLHNFLKKWSKSRSLTKTCIGRFTGPTGEG